jgi:hypothetical protein
MVTILLRVPYSDPSVNNIEIYGLVKKTTAAIKDVIVEIRTMQDHLRPICGSQWKAKACRRGRRRYDRRFGF